MPLGREARIADSAVEHAQRVPIHQASSKNVMNKSSFGCESDLVNSFVGEASFALFPRMLIAAREVRGLDGIADIVLARPRTIEDYAAAFSIDADGCVASCRFHASRSRNEGLACLFEDIVAIEAKLQDWTRGIYQASRYRQFAQRTYVLVDEDGLRRAMKRRDVFERSGVGLIGRVGKGFKVFISSPRSRPVVQLSESFIRSASSAPHLLNTELLLEPFAPFPQVAECPGWSGYIAASLFGS
jgi:hypothetical protein